MYIGDQSTCKVLNNDTSFNEGNVILRAAEETYIPIHHNVTTFTRLKRIEFEMYALVYLKGIVTSRNLASETHG